MTGRCLLSPFKSFPVRTKSTDLSTFLSVPLQNLEKWSKKGLYCFRCKSLFPLFVSHSWSRPFSSWLFSSLSWQSLQRFKVWFAFVIHVFLNQSLTLLLILLLNLFLCFDDRIRGICFRGINFTEYDRSLLHPNPPKFFSCSQHEWLHSLLNVSSRNAWSAHLDVLSLRWWIPDWNVVWITRFWRRYRVRSDCPQL